MANPLHGLEHGVMMVTRAIPKGSCDGNTYKLYARYASLCVKLWIDWAVQEMHGLHRFSGTDFFFHCVPLAETLKQNSELFFHSQYFTNLIHIFLDYAYTL